MLTAILVEDDAGIRGFVKAALEAEGWRVHEVERAERALIDAASRKPDLMLLDLGLPDGDGVDVVRRIRQWSGMPVIVISARTAEADKIRALDAGADDYLAKPFGVGELLARVRANLRRVRAADTSQVFAFGDVTIDLTARVVHKAGQEVHLTPVEYRLIAHLATHAGRVRTHRQLLAEVWGPSHTEDAQYLRVYMGHLRRKLEDDPSRPAHIVTETGVGYRLKP